jgi:hypothetical protein
MFGGGVTETFEKMAFPKSEVDGFTEFICWNPWVAVSEAECPAARLGVCTVTETFSIATILCVPPPNCWANDGRTARL